MEKSEYNRITKQNDWRAEMEKEKQIDEIAWELCDVPKHPSIKSCEQCGNKWCHARHYVKIAIEKSYRKERVGHWFIREYEFFTCSECGHDYWNSCDCTKEAKEKLSKGDTPNFCPNCGAKMRGE